MDCVKAAGLFDSYIDGTLSAATLRELEEHLASCPTCREEVASLRALTMSLRALPQPELPPGFNQALHEKIAAEPAPPKPALWQRGWVKGLAAAACLVLVISAVAVSSNTLRGDGIYYMSGAGSSSAAPMAAAEAPAAPPAPMPTAETFFDIDAAEEEAALPAPALREASSTQAQLERKIIRDANLSLRVENFDQAYQTLLELAERYGGYVAASDAYSYDGENMQRGYVMLRVEASRLDEALAEIDTLGKVENQSQNTQDVTMTYYDIAGRLEQYQAQEQRLLDILRKAETVEELIPLEAELTRVRAELESLTGQLRYYDQMTALSSINVNLYQPDESTRTVRLSGWAGFAQEIREGFISGVNGLLTALSGLAVAFMRLLPTLLLLTTLVLIVLLLFRKRRKGGH